MYLLARGPLNRGRSWPNGGRKRPQVYSAPLVALPPQTDPRRYDWSFCRNRNAAIRQAGKVDDETVLILAASIMQAGANVVFAYVANRLVQACKAIGGVQWLY
jgi:DNA-binding transcriptional LysR family regulator